MVKNLPAMQETPVQFLGWEDTSGEEIGYPLQYFWASLMAQLVKNPPAMQEPWVQSLVWEDPLKKGKATHSEFAESDTTKRLSLSLSVSLHWPTGT